jgi:hypothetical protein
VVETENDRRWREREERVEKARARLDRLPSWLTVDFGDVWGRRKSAPVVTKLKEAFSALREWRHANQQSERLDDEVALAIRVVADAMATDIGEAAGPHQDPATIAWVMAGLRCPRRPFCRGCDSCFTIDAPHRADEQFRPVPTQSKG